MIQNGKVVDEETIYLCVKGFVEDIIERNDKQTNERVLVYVKALCDNNGIPMYDLKKVWFKILKELKR